MTWKSEIRKDFNPMEDRDLFVIDVIRDAEKRLNTYTKERNIYDYPDLEKQLELLLEKIYSVCVLDKK